MEPDPNNPAGYYEHLPIYNLHGRILAALGRPWDTTFPLPPNWHRSKNIVPFRDELIEIIETRFVNKPLWAWKDPRSSILLPLWKDVLAKLEIELQCLLVYRNPLDVAKSLRSRDGLSKNESLGVWLNYSLAMLQNSMGLPRAMVFYHELLAAPEKSLKHLASRLPLNWFPEDTRLAETIRDTLRMDLCHSESTFRDLIREGCPIPILELARLLDGIARTGDLESLHNERKIRRMIMYHESYASLYFHDLKKVIHTYSWRLTKPLRAVMEVLFTIRWRLNVIWHHISTR